MASLVYNVFKVEGAADQIDWLNDTVQVALVTSGYVADVDHTAMDMGGANDPVDHEISTANYAPGYAGSGRKTVGTKSIATNHTLDRAELKGVIASWGPLGAGATIKAALFHRRGSSSDANSRLIAYVEFGTPIATSDVLSFEMTYTNDVILTLS